jgi:hypothetical protein
MAGAGRIRITAQNFQDKPRFSLNISRQVSSFHASTCDSPRGMAIMSDSVLSTTNKNVWCFGTNLSDMLFHRLALDEMGREIAGDPEDAVFRNPYLIEEEV